MWRTLTVDDVEGVDRFASVMRRMDDRYARVQVPALRSKIRRERGLLLLYESPEVCVALAFYFDPTMARYHACTGFVGETSPRQVLDLIGGQAIDFIRERRLDAIYAWRPRVVADEPLRELHDAIKDHPWARVTVEAELPDVVILRIEDNGAKPTNV